MPFFDIATDFPETCVDHQRHAFIHTPTLRLVLASVFFLGGIALVIQKKNVRRFPNPGAADH